MILNRAFGKEPESLHVAIIENKRGMTTILRTLLTSFGIRNVSYHDDPESALSALRSELPDLVITRDRIKPMDGISFVRLLRQKSMAPACFAAVIMVSAVPKKRLLEEALGAGVHTLLRLPTSARVLYDHIVWVTRDDRPLILNQGRYEIEGVRELLKGGGASGRAGKQPAAMPASPRLAPENA
ncbi:MAG: response regulator, partial [Alphaproteobacteria bacterium]